MNKNQNDRSYVEKEILRPFEYIKQAKSNSVITYDLPEAVNCWLKVPQDQLKQIQDITESFVNVSFIFDDIQDNTKTRRGIPCAHILFGMPLAINSCVQSYTQIISRVAELGPPMAVKIFLEQSNKMLVGQGADIYWRENLTFFSEDDYKWMAELKSSAVLLLPIKLMELFSKIKVDYTKLITLFGLYYEIRDDYCNLAKQDGVEGKQRAKKLEVVNSQEFCEDFTDGKFSFPILHAIRTSSDASPIIYALKQRTRDLEVKKYCLWILKQLGSLDYTLSVLRGMDRELRDELRLLGGNSKFEAILDDMYV